MSTTQEIKGWQNFAYKPSMMGSNKLPPQHGENEGYHRAAMPLYMTVPVPTKPT